jgi:hypothetical protein
MGMAVVKNRVLLISRHAMPTMKKWICRSGLLAMLFFAPWSFAQNTRIMNEAASAQANIALSENNGFRRLHALLGAEYAQFMLDFEHLAVPAKLKDGGVFVEGWRENAISEHSSAVVLYPDGRIYAAYYDVENGDIRYFGSDSVAEIHPAILVWSRRFGPGMG